MTIHYRIDAPKRRIATTVRGDVTIDDVLEHFDELSADSNYAPGLDVLLDLIDCKALWDADQIRAVAAHATADLSRFRFGRLAIVTVSDVLFGTFRMFHAFSEGAFSEAQIFRNRDEALKWLDDVGPTR